MSEQISNPKYRKYSTSPNVPKEFDEQAGDLWKAYCQKKIEVDELDTTDLVDIKKLCELQIHSSRLSLNFYYASGTSAADQLVVLSVYQNINEQVKDLKLQLFGDPKIMPTEN